MERKKLSTYLEELTTKKSKVRKVNQKEGIITITGKTKMCELENTKMLGPVNKSKAASLKERKKTTNTNHWPNKPRKKNGGVFLVNNIFPENYPWHQGFQIYLHQFEEKSLS